MEYRNLGKTGLKVSRIGLGCMSYGAPASGELQAGRHAWTLNEEESQPFLRRALELGINFFDTANVYSSGAGPILQSRAFSRRSMSKQRLSGRARFSTLILAYRLRTKKLDREALPTVPYTTIPKSGRQSSIGLYRKIGIEVGQLVLTTVHRF